MSNEKQYLEELTQKINQAIDQINDLDPDEIVDQRTYEILKKLIDSETKYRTDNDIGVRFNVLKTQLDSIKEKIAKEVGVQKKPESTQNVEMSKDETLVYVYLFNATGDKLASWQKLLTPSALFEHSVNRPVYANKADLQKMLRGKTNLALHGYLEITINKSDIMMTSSRNQLHDILNSPLLRLKQGALKQENIRCLFHNEKQYRIGKNNSLELIN